MSVFRTFLVSISLMLMVANLTLMVANPALAENPTVQKIVIKMDHGTDDLHSVSMALKVGKMLVERKHDVTLFLNLEAVRLVDTTQPTDLTWGQSSMTVEDLYSEYVQAGGKVLVCPHCAKAAGVKSLRKGAKMAQETDIAELIVAADKVIDY